MEKHVGVWPTLNHLRMSAMSFIDAGLHAARFACRCRAGRSKSEFRNDQETRTFDLSAEWPALRFQTRQPPDRLELEEAGAQVLGEQAPPAVKLYAARIEMSAGMKGINAFIPIAVVADISEAGRFKGSKAFASRLRPVPEAADSTAPGAGEQGRKLSAVILSQSLNHALNGSTDGVSGRRNARKPAW
jgi:hypothetical protein